MKTTSKLLCLILAIMMMLPMIASCDLFGKKDEDTPATTTATTTASGDNNQPGDDTNNDNNTAARDEVYNMTGLEDKSFDGVRFTVGYSFGGGTYISEWIPKPVNPRADELEDNIVAEASFKRDQRFETLTGARLVYNGFATNPNVYSGAYSESVNFITLNTGNLLKNFDMLMFGATTAGKLIPEKILLDMNEYDNLIHHDKDYYTSTLNKQLTIGGRQFAAAGYYTTGNLRGSQAICVNNTLLTNQAGTDLKQELYEVALDKEWTFEKMLSYDFAFATGTIRGDETDKYTFVTGQYGVENLYYVMGGTHAVKNAQDLPVVSINSAENQALLQKIQDYTSSKYVMVARESGHGKYFSQEQAIFEMSMLGAYGSVRNAKGIDEILMPSPTENEGDDYISYLPTWNANYSGIPVQVENPETSAYLYEMYMALSYNYIYPAFFEKTMKLTYAQNANEAKIYDIIASTLTLDLAAVYGWVNAQNTDIRNMVDSVNPKDVTATTDALAATLKVKINEFLASYEIN